MKEGQNLNNFVSILANMGTVTERFKKIDID